MEQEAISAIAGGFIGMVIGGSAVYYFVFYHWIPGQVRRLAGKVGKYDA